MAGMRRGRDQRTDAPNATLGAVNIMRAHPLVSRVKRSVSFGGAWAALFAPIFFLVLLGTILMVRGDGRGPGVVGVAGGIVGGTARLLGLSLDGAIFPVVAFWSLVVFFGAFTYALFSKNAGAKTDGEEGFLWPLGVTVVVGWAILFLIQSHGNEAASLRERTLALQFVRDSPQVLQAAGGDGRVDLAYYIRSPYKPPMYVVGVHGTNTLYAVVEASGSSPAPTFRLLCTTSMHVDKQDHFHPCPRQ